MTVRELGERWLTPRGRDLAAEIAFRLVSGESFNGLDVGTYGGRVDLRGFRLPSPEAIERIVVGRLTATVIQGTIAIGGVRWEGLDLSYSVLPSLRFFESVIDDCVFDGARCQDWRLWRTDVSRSRFVGCDLRYSAMGTFDGRANSWVNVVFDRADLRDTHPERARFEGCDFLGSKLRGVQFEGCSLKAVRFSGVLRDVLFDCRELPNRPEPDPMTNVDFSGAEFHDVDFRACRFVDVVLPDEPGLRLVPNFPAVARRQLELLEENNSLEARQVKAVLEMELPWPGRPDSVGVFSRRDHLSSGGEPLADLAEQTLLQALLDVDRNH